MKIRKTTEISIHTERLILVRKRESPSASGCPECGAPLHRRERPTSVNSGVSGDESRDKEQSKANRLESSNGEHPSGGNKSLSEEEGEL